jgi:hypothetical protein
MLSKDQEAKLMELLCTPNKTLSLLKPLMKEKATYFKSSTLTRRKSLKTSNSQTQLFSGDGLMTQL